MSLDQLKYQVASLAERVERLEQGPVRVFAQMLHERLLEKTPVSIRTVADNRWGYHGDVLRIEGGVVVIQNRDDNRTVFIRIDTIASIA